MLPESQYQRLLACTSTRNHMIVTKGYLGRNGGHLDSFVFTFVVFAFKQ